VRNGVEEGGLAPKPVSGEGYLHYEVLKDTVVDTSSLKYPKISPDDPAIFQYSGGTTGTPKAAIGSHRNIVANVTQFMVWCGLQAGQETILGVIPLYHVYGMVLTMHLALAAGGQLVLVDDPTDTERILREIETRQVSFYPGVPAMFYAITQNPKVRSGDFNIHSIKACISGSAPLHPSIKADFERMTGGKLVEGYGLSEAPTATHCNPVNGCNKAGSIGLPLPDVECRVVDLHKGIREMPHGEPGELILKGPQVMSGYHHQPKEEKIALRDGWLYTGDVVKMDGDGYFFIVDRKKSLIKVSGFQVWPSEVERVIVSHPDVENCAVGGVPDLKQGEMVIAWVVRKTNKKLSEEDVRGWCQQRLASYKIPSVILFRENLPKSGVGKVLRRELIAEYIEKEAS
jgi:long-chain acyl-CoA synthetase